MDLWKIIGANPWVIHQDTEVYGEDVEAFRPDRWLKELYKDGTGDMGKLLMCGTMCSMTC